MRIGTSPFELSGPSQDRGIFTVAVVGRLKRNSPNYPGFSADCSGFLGLPGGPTLLVAGRLQSGPGAVFLGPKCWIFLGIWAHSSCRLTLERMTIGRLSQRGRRLRPQLCNQLQNLPEHLPGNGDLGHLEGSAAAVTDDLGADLDQLSPLGAIATSP